MKFGDKSGLMNYDVLLYSLCFLSRYRDAAQNNAQLEYPRYGPTKRPYISCVYFATAPEVSLEPKLLINYAQVTHCVYPNYLRVYSSQPRA